MGWPDGLTTFAYRFQLMPWAYLQAFNLQSLGFSSIEQLDFKDLEDLPAGWAALK